MKLKNASKELPQTNGQLVLICVEDVYYYATYDSIKKQFRVEEQRVLIFRPSENTIFWTEIIDH